MTIELPPDVENSLLAKVHSGLFPSLDAAMTKAAYGLPVANGQKPTLTAVRPGTRRLGDGPGR